MPRPKKPRPSQATKPSIPPSKTSHLFSRGKAGDRAPLTHDRIAADIQAFRKAGGTIEVLGVTRTLQRIDTDGTPPSSPADPTKPPRRR